MSKQAPFSENIIMGDYPGQLKDFRMLVIGTDGDYFKYKMSEREREQILAGLEFIGIIK